MCWSGEASAVVAALGIGTTIYAAYKGEDRVLWITLAYFSLMEVLQAFTYLVINECNNPWNQIATLLGYIHIAFQPFFINAIALYFIPEQIRKKIELPVYTLCFISTVIMIIQGYPFPWAGQCPLEGLLCGSPLCSVSGNFHIAWDIPYNQIGIRVLGVDLSFISYLFVGIIVPFIYGSWRMNLYHIIMGPTISYMITDNNNEWPAIWCLLSIGFLLIVIKTPVRKYLYVKSWFLWPIALYINSERRNCNDSSKSPRKS